MNESNRENDPREVEITGIRASLRDWRGSDLASYAEWLQPGHRWQELDGPYYPKPTAEQIPKIVADKRAEIEAAKSPTPRERLVISPRDSENMLGMVSRAWESRETNWLTVGIVIFDPEWWGRGIGYESLGLWSDYLFREMPEIARLDLRTWSGNIGMMSLARKLGYREEARFRKARIVDGEYYDGLGYGVLREEWGDLYPTGFLESLSIR